LERHSRFVLLIKVRSRDTAEVVGALSKHVRKLPATLRRSLTWDRGLEMAKHKNFTVATDVKVYFCDPQSPWQRGSNENTNGLLRQYFPKNTDLTNYSQSDLNKVALRLNQRPRQTLGFQTPASKLQESVASTIETTRLIGSWRNHGGLADLASGKSVVPGTEVYREFRATWRAGLKIHGLPPARKEIDGIRTN
jgi:hypothetical protein